MIWEFAIFRKLVREKLEEIASGTAPEDLFAARELILEITDRSEVGSIHQYVEETSRERDAARDALREANEQIRIVFWRFCPTNCVIRWPQYDRNTHRARSRQC